MMSYTRSPTWSFTGPVQGGTPLPPLTGALRSAPSFSRFLAWRRACARRIWGARAVARQDRPPRPPDREDPRQFVEATSTLDPPAGRDRRPTARAYRHHRLDQRPLLIGQVGGIALGRKSHASQSLHRHASHVGAPRPFPTRSQLSMTVTRRSNRTSSSDIVAHSDLIAAYSGPQELAARPRLLSGRRRRVHSHDHLTGQPSEHRRPVRQAMKSRASSAPHR